jgi:hypothetical protein
MKKIIFALAAVCWAGAASAAQITIQSVSGTWDAISVVDNLGGNANLTGEGTNTIRWGRSYPGYSGRSGFSFVGTSNVGPFDVDTLFKVGDFTHMNRVIYMGQHVDVAQLNLTVTASFDGMLRTFNTSYRFSLWETPNLANPCGNGQQNFVPGTVNENGCADRVRLLKNDSLTDVFEHNGLTYQFDLFGFLGGRTYWTIENLNNTTALFARFLVSGNPPPPPPTPTVIPLPAAGWLLLGALGGVAGLRRLRRR